MPPLKVAVLASGRGTNLQALLDELADPASPARVSLVISNRPTAGALERAARANVPTATIADDGQDAAGLLALLARHDIGLLVLAGYLKLVPAPVVRAYRGRILNVHPALLPTFGGAGMYGRRVHEAVLASGARTTGVTVHLVDEEYDRGTILAQWPVPVRPGDSADALAARVLAVEHRLLPAVVRAFARRGSAPVCSLAAESFVAATTLPSRLDDALTMA